MKLLVATRADTKIKGYTDITHPVIKWHVNKWGADFHIFSDESPCKVGDGIGHYRILQMYDLFDEYDRIIQLDSDIMINKTCPDLFQMVPEDCIGSIYEDLGSRRGARRTTMRQAQNHFGDIEWTEDYINTGVFVVSKQHRDIFLPIDGKYWEGWGWDDIHLGYQINRLGYKVHELSYLYNHMTMFSEKWNGSPNRFNSHIIHYAGAGVFDHGPKNKQIANDYKRIYGDG